MHQFFSSCCSRGPSLSLNTYRRAYREISLPDNSWMKWLLALWRHPRIAPSHETAGPNALSTAAQGFSTALSLHNAIPYGKRQGEQFAENLGYLNAGKEYRLAVSFRDFRPGRGFLPSDGCWRYVVDAFPKSIFISHDPFNVIDEQKFVGLGG